MRDPQDNNRTKSELKARSAALLKKMTVSDEGHGNISHLAKTVKRGKAHLHGVSHWNKQESPSNKINY